MSDQQTRWRGLTFLARGRPCHVPGRRRHGLYPLPPMRVAPKTLEGCAGVVPPPRGGTTPCGANFAMDWPRWQGTSHEAPRRGGWDCNAVPRKPRGALHPPYDTLLYVFAALPRPFSRRFAVEPDSCDPGHTAPACLVGNSRSRRGPLGRRLPAWVSQHITLAFECHNLARVWAPLLLPLPPTPVSYPVPKHPRHIPCPRARPAAAVLTDGCCFVGWTGRCRRLRGVLRHA